MNTVSLTYLHKIYNEICSLVGKIFVILMNSDTHTLSCSVMAFVVTQFIASLTLATGNCRCQFSL